MLYTNFSAIRRSYDKLINDNLLLVISTKICFISIIPVIFFSENNSYFTFCICY